MSLIADDICSKKISTSNFHFLSNFLSKMLLFLISSPIVTCKKIAIGVMQLLAELKSLSNVYNNSLPNIPSIQITYYQRYYSRTKVLFIAGEL